MIRDITIGQYYHAESVIHGLDPRTKLVATFFYMISMFCFDQYIGLVVSAIFLLWVVRLAKIPLGHMVKGLKPVLVILLFSLTANVLFSAGEPLFHWGIISITLAGIKRAIFTGIRLCLLVFGASVVTFTTTPNQLTDGIEKLFQPWKRIHLPVHEIAMMMSIALRFIPILLEETDKIMKAQMARGADFETGGLIKKVKNLLPIIVPLFISAFRRADDLAMAMDARCYRGGDGRTKMKPLTYKREDYLAYLALGLYLVVLFCLVYCMTRLISMF